MQGIKDVHIREAVASDYDFIFASWCGSYTTALHSRTSGISVVVLRQMISDMISGMFQRKEFRCDVICSDNDHDFIVGYICYSIPCTIHWAYIRRAGVAGPGFRGCGLFSDLLRRVNAILKAPKLYYWASAPASCSICGKRGIVYDGMSVMEGYEGPR